MNKYITILLICGFLLLNKDSNYVDSLLSSNKNNLSLFNNEVKELINQLKENDIETRLNNEKIIMDTNYNNALWFYKYLLSINKISFEKYNLMLIENAIKYSNLLKDYNTYIVTIKNLNLSLREDNEYVLTTEANITETLNYILIKKHSKELSKEYFKYTNQSVKYYNVSPEEIEKFFIKNKELKNKYYNGLN